MSAAGAHAHFLGTWILDHLAYLCHHLCPCMSVMSQGLAHCCNHHCWHLSIPPEGPKTHLTGPAITSAQKHHVGIRIRTIGPLPPPWVQKDQLIWCLDAKQSLNTAFTNNCSYISLWGTHRCHQYCLQRNHTETTLPCPLRIKAKAPYPTKTIDTAIEKSFTTKANEQNEK